VNKLLVISSLVTCLAISGCDRHDPKPEQPCCSSMYTVKADFPYDATTVDGVFLANVITDVTDSKPLKASYVAVLNAAADTAKVSANGLKLDKVAGKYISDLEHITFDTSLNEFNVSWIVNSNPGNNFSYNNVDTFPSCKFILPDTITRGINTIFYFDESILERADTVMLTIYSPAGTDSINHLNYYASASVADRLEIPNDVARSLSGKSIRTSISVFNSRTYAINGKDYLFIKEQTQSGYVWFR